MVCQSIFLNSILLFLFYYLSSIVCPLIYSTLAYSFSPWHSKTRTTASLSLGKVGEAAVSQLTPFLLLVVRRSRRSRATFLIISGRRFLGKRHPTKSGSSIFFLWEVY